MRASSWIRFFLIVAFGLFVSPITGIVEASCGAPPVGTQTRDYYIITDLVTGEVEDITRAVGPWRCDDFIDIGPSSLHVGPDYFLDRQDIFNWQGRKILDLDFGNGSTSELRPYLDQDVIIMLSYSGGSRIVLDLQTDTSREEQLSISIDAIIPEQIDLWDLQWEVLQTRDRVYALDRSSDPLEVVDLVSGHRWTLWPEDNQGQPLSLGEDSRLRYAHGDLLLIDSYWYFLEIPIGGEANTTTPPADNSDFPNNYQLRTRSGQVMIFVRDMGSEQSIYTVNLQTYDRQQWTIDISDLRGEVGFMHAVEKGSEDVREFLFLTPWAIGMCTGVVAVAMAIIIAKNRKAGHEE